MQYIINFACIKNKKQMLKYYRFTYNIIILKFLTSIKQRLFEADGTEQHLKENGKWPFSPGGGAESPWPSVRTKAVERFY